MKVSNLIVKAKENYYRTQVTKLRKRNQSKWYQAIFDLTSTNSQQNSNLPTDDTTSVAEQLQRSFVKPWQEATPSAIPGINDVSHLLEDVPPPTPSIGQVKAELRHLNSKKSTGIDGIPAWVLKRFHEELALVVHNIINLGKKCNLNSIFHAKKGHFAPGKRALGKTWGGWPPWPSGSYAPASNVWTSTLDLTA